MTPQVQQRPPDVTDDTAPQEAQSAPTTPPPPPPTPEPAAPVGQAPITPIARTRRGWNWPLRIVGIVMALGGGIALAYVLPALSMNSDIQVWLFLLSLVAWAALAAALLRSLWAALVVPVLSIVGLFVGGSIQTYGFDVQAWFANGLGDVDVVVLYIVLPWVVGAIIGTPLGAWLDERMRR